MRYGRYGKLEARPGQRDAVVAILVRAAEEMATQLPGCLLYLVSESSTEPDIVWVTEVWASREDHQASLQLPSVKTAISEAMPLLTGRFDGDEVVLVGGVGLDDDRRDPAAGETAR